MVDVVGKEGSSLVSWCLVLGRQPIPLLSILAVDFLEPETQYFLGPEIVFFLVPEIATSSFKDERAVTVP